jgi:Flp pilus assembly pilin Flp
MWLIKISYRNQSQRGANLVEYSLVVALISMIVVGGAKFLGFSIAGKYIASAIELGQCMPAGLIQTICVNGNCNAIAVTVNCADEVGEEEIN